jgi:hypothetical protein
VGVVVGSAGSVGGVGVGVELLESIGSVVAGTAPGPSSVQADTVSSAPAVTRVVMSRRDVMVV